MQVSASLLNANGDRAACSRLSFQGRTGTGSKIPDTHE